jgi:hypothetical protein
VGSVIAQNQGSGVQILAAFVSPAGAFVITYSNRLRCGYIVMPGQRLRYQNNLCGCYSDEGMTLLELQTIYARLEEILKADRLQRTQLFGGGLDAVHKLSSSTETYTFRPKFQVNPEATLIARSLARQQDLGQFTAPFKMRSVW